MSEQTQLPLATPPAAVQNAPGPPVASPAGAPREANIRGHSPARDQREGAATHAPAPAAASAKPAPIKIGEAEYSAEELQGLAEHKATEDVRKASLPPTPDAYELKLPDDFKAPAGVEFKFATDDPVMGQVINQARNFAHANGLSQEQFSGMMGLYAAAQSQEQSFFAAAQAKESAALGVNGGPRVDAVSQWLDTFLGKEVAAPFKATLVTARQVAGWEKIVHALSSQGGAPFSQSHRTAPDTNEIPGFADMSFEQRRFAQDQQRRR